jgi:succinate-semialdehyde dehydrogenase/glutarate-semialdehyde dehydrogenase
MRQVPRDPGSVGETDPKGKGFGNHRPVKEPHVATVTDILEVRSPYDGSLLDTLPLQGPEVLDSLVERASQAQRAWARTSWEERRRLFLEARRRVLGRARDLARQMAAEQGKPWVEAVSSDVVPTLEALAFMGNQAQEILSPENLPHRLPHLAAKQTRLVYDPIGVVAIISPWNFPLSIPAIQTVTALAAGNAVILRPSTSTPLVARMFVELLEEAGFPQGLLQLLVCRTSVAEQLVSHPGVGCVCFTGSVEVGRRIMELAAREPKKAVLELGGKDPALVFADADLERAARGCTWAAFFNAGQACASIERVYVQREVLPAFLERVEGLIRQIRLGDPLRDDVDMGPMTTESGASKVMAQVDQARLQGARLLTGGSRQGRLVQPVLLTDVDHSMEVMRLETFGPVMPVMAFDSEDEAVALANDSGYGLTASVWTTDRQRGRRVAARLRAGSVTLNDHAIAFAEGALPWGGPRPSSVGRTHGRFGLLEMVEPKAITEDWSRYPGQLWWFPYDRAGQQVLMASLPAVFGVGLGARLAGLLKMTPALPHVARHSDLGKVLAALPRRWREP